MKDGAQSVAISERQKNDLLKKLFLYCVGLRDLKVAESCFDELKELPTNKFAEIDNVAKAFAFIMCYGRIFHFNAGIGKLKGKSFLKKLTEDEKKEHEALLNMRNEEYAHNDPQHNQLFVYYDGEKQSIVAVAQFSYHIFSQNNKHTISSLIGKIRMELEGECDKVKERLYLDRLKGSEESQSFVVTYYSEFTERKITGKG